MDVLRKEINSVYELQNLSSEILDRGFVDRDVENVRRSVELTGDCKVVTDASADLCWICGGAFAVLLGIQNDPETRVKQVSSSDEDEIYSRIHPEDLVDKRMLEYEFFKFVDSLPPEKKPEYKATCRIRIMGREGGWLNVWNTTRILRLSPRGKFWLILCTYDFSPYPAAAQGINPSIVNSTTGEIIRLEVGSRRREILSEREREILLLVRDGFQSKEIADRLNISIHTVNRHRQNILEKLSVGNSMEAVKAAEAMRLL